MAIKRKEKKFLNMRSRMPIKVSWLKKFTPNPSFLSQDLKIKISFKDKFYNNKND